jgi:hypothetical protein
LRTLIERLVLCALVAVSRKSGPKPLIKVAQKLEVTLTGAKRNNAGPGIAGLVASGVLFFAGLFIIAEVLLQLDGPVDALVGRSATEGLWPSTLEYTFDELWAIALPIGVCMVLAVSKLVPCGEAKEPEPDPDAEPASTMFDDFLDFVRSNAAVLLLCIVTTIAIKIGLMFWEYGTLYLPADARSPLRLTLPVLQAFIAVAVCVLTTWYLVSSARKGTARGPSFARTILLIAVATGFLALLYDFAFLDQYLNAHPESRPGSEHHLFSVVANALVSICAFVSVVVFFKARRGVRSSAARDGKTAVATATLPATHVQAPPLAPSDALDVSDHGHARLGV